MRKRTLTAESTAAGLKMPTVWRRIKSGMARADALSKPLARKWTPTELELLKRFYATTGPIDLTRLTKLLRRDRANICRKARALGMTDKKRIKNPQPHLDFGIAQLSREQQSAFLSKRAKQHIAKNGHPRGALGMKHSEETKARMSEAARRAWADPTSKLNSEANRQRRSDALLSRLVSGEMRPKYSRCRGGRREDIGGMYFRSRWEANYARFLNVNLESGMIQAWEYEPRTFVFESIKRGTRAYTPDFRVTLASGEVEWHEVKGWMDQKSQTRLRRMAKYYPEEKIVVVDGKWFRSAKSSGLAATIPGWE